MKKIRPIAKYLLIVVFASLAVFTACKKPISLDDDVLDKDDQPFIGKKSDIPNDTTYVLEKNVAITLGTLTVTDTSDLLSVVPNFRDTAIASLNLLSRIFSSKEFKDSLYKYTFPCANAFSGPCLDSRPWLHRYKCDNTLQVIKGQTVYEDLTAQATRSINLTIRKGSVFGSAAPCGGTIYSNDWFLKGGRELPTYMEYAIHLSHEYSHILGYVHGTSNSQSVANRVAGIVKNIIKRQRNMAAIDGEELSGLIGQPNFKFMKVRMADGLQYNPLNPFMVAYNQTLTAFNNNNQNISYIYLEFLSNNKAKLGLRATNMSSGTYFVITFELDLTIDSDGLGTFVYHGVTTANTDNKVRVKPIIDYLTAGAFELSFMDRPAPASSIVGGFTSVQNSSSFVYGTFLNSL